MTKQEPVEGWACYHTELLIFNLDKVGDVGIVGWAVGAAAAMTWSKG